MSARIRLAREADADPIRSIYAPVVAHTVISFEVDPPTTEEMRRRMAEVLTGFPWIVCENGGHVLGYAYATGHRARAAYRWSVDTSVYVDGPARGMGVGRALYRSLLNLLVLQGFCNAYAGITLPNPASVGLHEAMGYRAVGVYRSVGFKQGAWHDVGWWHLALGPYPREPAAPRALEAVRETPAWVAAAAAGLPFLRLPET